MAIYLTLVLIVLNHIAFGGSRVVVSLFALESGATQMEVGMLMALYALCPMLFAIAIGRLADRVGPRLPMLLGSAGLVRRGSAGAWLDSAGDSIERQLRESPINLFGGGSNDIQRDIIGFHGLGLPR